MADIRIKDLATTASSTASDDFLAVDGSANGTRKLNAYSPTFGGNLTVSGGTITSGSGTLTLNSSANTVVLQSAGTTALTLDSSQNATFAGFVTSGGGFISKGTINIPSAAYASLESASSVGYLTSYNGAGSAYLPMTYRASLHEFTQGPIAINNTVQTAAAVVSTHKVTISIGGSTYYLLATNV